MIRTMVARQGSLGARVRAILALCAATSLSLTAASASAAPPVPTRDAYTKGLWGPLGKWPLIAAHATLTPGGKVLTFGTDAKGKQTGLFIYDVWDAATGDVTAGHLTLPNGTNTDIFCSSALLIPDGRSAFIAGGDVWNGTKTTNTGNPDVTAFDTQSNALSRAGSMNRARWYSTSTMLADGQIYIQGGTGGTDYPELRSGKGQFTLLPRLNTAAINYFYPRNFVLPDARLFGFDGKGKMYFIEANLSSLTRAGQLAAANIGNTASAVMYAPGKVLQVGGGSNQAVTIDMTGFNPKVQPTGYLTSQRQWVSATLLANGSVLATGGSQKANELVGVNNTAEVWNPATGVWTAGSQGAVARLYHSTALLLPDATVLVAGGGAPGPLINTNAELYYPPYLFTADGKYAARPVIQSAPDVTGPGERITLKVGDSSSVARVVLVRTGSATHSFDMGQGFVELPFARLPDNALSADLPVNANVAIPGTYMLFVLDAQGVPSVAKMLRVRIVPNQLDAPQSFTAQSAILRSPASRYVLQLRADGNLVLARAKDGKVRWATQTQGQGVVRAALQTDGNLVLYTAANRAVWASGTAGKGVTRALLQDDGNFVLYKGASTGVWASNTAVPSSTLAANQALRGGQNLTTLDEAFDLKLRTDGNLVLLRKSDGAKLWSSHTSGKGATQALMQADGNFVLYNASNKAVWSTGTKGSGAVRVTVQDDGNVVLYKADGSAVWDVK
jgi:hypothetical protein